jgi:hypothetical protein
MSAKVPEGVEITPVMIAAAARVLADAFELEIDGYRACAVAEDVIRAALQVRPNAKSKTL